MTTPTSHIPHNLLKLAQIVTTSTPTHPAVGGWALFPEQSADSPLSEIENTESPAQSIGNEVRKRFLFFTDFYKKSGYQIVFFFFFNA